MSLRLRDALMRELATLRYEPIDKRIRGVLGGETVIDSKGHSAYLSLETAPDVAWTYPQPRLTGFRAFRVGGAAHQSHHRKPEAPR